MAKSVPKSARKAPKRAAPPQDLIVSRARLAQIMGVSVRTVNRLSKQHKLPSPVATGKWDIGEVVRFLIQRIADAEAISGDQSADDRYKNARAEKMELGVAKEKEVLILRDKVLRDLGPRFGAFRSLVMGLPSRVVQYVPEEHRGDVRQEVMEMLEDALREIASSMFVKEHRP